MRRKILLRSIVMLTQLPVYVYDRNGEEIEKYEIISRNVNVFESSLIREINQRLKTENFVVMEYHDILPVRMYGLRGAGHNYLLGPFAYGSLESEEIQLYMRREKIEDFPRVQIRESLLAANLILNTLSDDRCQSSSVGRSGVEGPDRERFWDGDAGIDLLESCLKEDEDIRMLSLVSEELRQNDNFQSNHTQDEENALYQYIEQGDAEYLQKNYDFLYLSHPVILEDLRRNEEYMAVIGISLASRAAIRGGLTSKEGFLVNDIYLKKLSQCKSITEIYDLVKEAHIYCASQVKKKRQARITNQYVERCKKIIISRRLETIELGELAEKMGISKEYLSRLFKQHEGIPIVEYILNVKIEAACNMLKYSDRQVNEIADYLSFGSLSYFSRIFKKKMGVSPQQYRKMIN
ncbi:MAG: helix-turn-helix transcriptional regulator [Ruminococcus sp.]|jgi:AraC-like DNA-binding protein|nr:helix-turn-helix transcriptional regulator [Ruminococcus sp.]